MKRQKYLIVHKTLADLPAGWYYPLTSAYWYPCICRQVEIAVQKCCCIFMPPVHMSKCPWEIPNPKLLSPEHWVAARCHRCVWMGERGANCKALWTKAPINEAINNSSLYFIHMNYLRWFHFQWSFHCLIYCHVFAVTVIFDINCKYHAYNFRWYLENLPEAVAYYP